MVSLPQWNRCLSVMGALFALAVFCFVFFHLRKTLFFCFSFGLLERVCTCFPGCYLFEQKRILSTVSQSYKHEHLPRSTAHMHNLFSTGTIGHCIAKKDVISLCNKPLLSTQEEREKFPQSLTTVKYGC